MREISIRRVAVLCAAALCLAVPPTTASATATQVEIDTAVDKAVDYVRSQQDPATGEPFGFDHGSFSSDWVATSLAAAGVSAADVRTAGNPSLQDFLLGDYTAFWTGPPPNAAVTHYERATLVAHAAGLDPSRLSAELNLPAQIAGRWNPATGSFGEPNINSAAFGILALKTAPVPEWALAPSATFLRQRQHDGGGWSFSAAMTPVALSEPSEPDTTGAVIAALCEAGAPAYDPPVATALAYLQGLLVNASGAFHYEFGDNADATAWAVSGLTACGIDPQAAEWTTAAGKTPIDHLLSLQVQSGPEAGGFGYESSGEAPNLYSTQDALRAIAGGVFTADPPARSDPSQPRVRPQPNVAAGTPVPHLLVVGRNPGNVRLCHVTAPAGAPLTGVLSAAQSGSYPAGCVTSFAVSGGKIASINGVAPANEDEAWLLRLDRGAEAIAGEQPVGFGEAIVLRLGQKPSDNPGPTGTPGPTDRAGAAGTVGKRGPRGKRGPKGRPGRNAHFTCRAHANGRSGKKRVRCEIKR